MAFNNLFSLMVGHCHRITSNGGSGMGIGNKWPDFQGQLFLNWLIKSPTGRPVRIKDTLGPGGGIKNLIMRMEKSISTTFVRKQIGFLDG